MRAKTKRTPRLVKVGVWTSGSRVLGWRVMWDGQAIGVISKPSPHTWEWSGHFYSQRHDAVEAVMRDAAKRGIVSLQDWCAL